MPAALPVPAAARRHSPRIHVCQLSAITPLPRSRFTVGERGALGNELSWVVGSLGRPALVRGQRGVIPLTVREAPQGSTWGAEVLQLSGVELLRSSLEGRL